MATVDDVAHPLLVNERAVPASVGQRLLLVANHYRSGGSAMNLGMPMRLRGRLDQGALRQAVTDLVARHEALRTRFVGRGPRLMQVIDDPEPFDVTVVDLAGATDVDERVAEAVGRDVHAPLDPAVGPLRVSLWRLSDDEHVLCVTVHHLVADAWACGLISRDLGLLYNRLAGDGAELPDVEWQFAQWATWQRALLESEAFERHAAYWRDQLAGMQALGLPRPRNRAPIGERRTGVEQLDLDRRVVEPLEHLAREQRTTLFGVMLALYFLLLQRVTGQTDIAVASVFANRMRREVQNTVGFLANIVVLRARLGGLASLHELVRDTHAMVMDAFVHQEVPYQLLPPGSAQADGTRVDEVMFQMLPEPVYQTRMCNLEMEPMTAPDGLGIRWDLELTLAPWDGGLKAVVLYADDRFDRVWARRFLDGYATLAGEVSRHLSAPTAAIAG